MSDQTENQVGRHYAPQVDRSLMEVHKAKPSPAEAPAESEATTPTEEVHGTVAQQPARIADHLPSPSQLRPANEEDYEPPTEGRAARIQRAEDAKAAKAGTVAKLILPDAAEARRRQLRRIERKESWVFQLTRRIQRIIMTANTMGGVGKTSDIGYSACIHASIANVPTLCVDANENSGPMYSFFGLQSREGTLQLRDAVHMREDLWNYSALDIAGAFRHPSGALLIGSDVSRNGKHKLELETFNQALYIWNLPFPLEYVDIGNGLNDPSTIGSAMMATNMNFAAVADRPQSFVHLVETMIEYQNMGFGDKVRNGFIVINGTHPDATPKYYLETIARVLAGFPHRNVYNEATGVYADVPRTLADLGIVEERIFLIPFSQHIKDNKVISTDKDVIGLGTYEAHLDKIIAIYLQNASYPPMSFDSVKQPEADTSSFLVPDESTSPRTRRTAAFVN